MKFTLYSCTAEKNRVNKDKYLNSPYAMEGALVDECSIINPIILVEKDNPTITMYNYAYISEFRRYYFITNMRAIRTGLWEISMHVDALYSWASYIRTTKAVINKAQSGSYNNYLNDNSLVFDSHVYNEVKYFPSGFNEQGTNILICAGGEVSTT